jgi:hypothetical protein
VEHKNPLQRVRWPKGAMGRPPYADCAVQFPHPGPSWEPRLDTSFLG